jgi:hypothetical protein
VNVVKTHRFDRHYIAVSRTVQDAFDKQLRYLLQNLRHPSLRAEKYDA